MSRDKFSNYSSDEHYLNFHRLLGKKTYALDLDLIEYKYKNGKIEPVAAFEIKHGNLSVPIFTCPSLEIANYLMVEGKRIPTFLVVSFCEVALFPVPMFYVVPVNDEAKEILHKEYWFSAKNFSIFQHTLRGVSWDGEEEYKGQKLKDLSDENVKYALPVIKL
jgi:hypothetical protein